MDDLKATAPATGGLADALDALSLRPWLLAALTLALGSFAQPYSHIYHDARLYSVQVLNRVEPGSYGNDLFFRYGSQDSYSLFSTLVAPLAGLLGISWTFFLLYLVLRTLFVLALIRLMFVFLGPTRSAVVVTVLLGGLTLPFGAVGTFNVTETFVTPRLPAFTLVLFGGAELLVWRPGRAALLIGLATLLHPLIAVVGFPLLLGWFVCRFWPRRGFALCASVVLLGLGLLCIPPFGRALFGAMDADWLYQVEQVSPLTWETRHWLPVVPLNLGIVALAAFVLRRGALARSNLLALVALLGLAGLTAMTLASVYGYRLLFQAQVSRFLWLTSVFAIPSAALLVVRARATGVEWRFLGAGVLAVLIVFPWRGALGVLFAVPPTVVLLLALRGRVPHWRALAVIAGLAVGLLVLDAKKTLDNWTSGRGDAILGGLSVGAWTLLLAGVVGVVLSRVRTGILPGRLALAAMLLFLAVNGTTFALRQIPSLRGPHGADAQFIAETINRSWQNGVRPTVYWSVDRVDLIWIEIRACSYFNRLQSVGALFNRGTFEESVRRARLVRHFELARMKADPAYRSYLPGSYFEKLLERFYGMSLWEGNPGQEHLEALVAEQGLDYVVTQQNFGGRYLATNGRVYVYDCRQLRSDRSATARTTNSVDSVDSIVNR